jgi:hypothetical protein
LSAKIVGTTYWTLTKVSKASGKDSPRMIKEKVTKVSLKEILGELDDQK